MEFVSVSLPAHSKHKVRVPRTFGQQRFDKGGDFRAVKLFIRADVHQVFSPRFGDSIPHGTVVTLVLIMQNDLSLGILPVKFQNDAASPVRTAVFHDNHLRTPFRMLAQNRVQVAKDTADVEFLVINGDNEADEGI